MSEQPIVVTDAPEQTKPRLISRLKAPAVKITATLAVVGLGAYALGRKTKSAACPCDVDDTETAGQTDPV